MPPVFEALAGELRAARGIHFARRSVELFLGSDREIGRESRSLERRVGIAPGQIAKLVALFKDLHLELHVLVLRGAGERAGFDDGQYVAAGADIVTEDQLAVLDGAPDVVHALKEPSRYEARIPGPFCRIGALHTGDFSVDSGLGRLLEADHGLAIFDGSSIGAPGNYRVPIRGRMSIYAGEIAAEWVVAHARQHGLCGPAVVVGAGNAGKAAARKLLADDSPISSVRLFDSADAPARLAAVRGELTDLPIEVLGLRDRDDEGLLAALDGAAGLIFAVARPGQRAPRVLHLESVRRLVEQALVVDISIDERGAVHDPAARSAWTAHELIPHLTRRIRELGRDYRALPNMPRAYPGPASVAHGEVILPYVTALLYRAAQLGGPRDVVTHLERLARRDGLDPAEAGFGQVLAALEQDLRNGLAFWTRPSPGRRERVVIEDAVADKLEIAGHLAGSGREVEFHLARRTGDKLRRNVLGGFDEAVAECLELALEKGIEAQVICHPGHDGTGTAGAAQALQVDERNVLKCLILTRHPEGETARPEDFAAAVVLGTRRVDFERFAAVAESGPWRLAGADEVADVTGHTLGGVPVIEVFSKVARVFVDQRVLALDRVWGSAGSEYAGMGFPPSVLVDLGAIPGELCQPESRVRHQIVKIRQALHALDKALDRDDDEDAARAVGRLARLIVPEG
jgi:alanine dehydrogenase